MCKLPAPQELISAIHAHCLQCSGGSRTLVERCNVAGCALLPYRSAKVMGISHGKEREVKGQMDYMDILEAGRNGR